MRFELYPRKFISLCVSFHVLRVFRQVGVIFMSSLFEDLGKIHFANIKGASSVILMNCCVHDGHELLVLYPLLGRRLIAGHITP